MQNPSEITNWYQTFTPDEPQRKNWYSSVSETYDRVRPKYPQELLDRAVELAGTPKNGDVLEVGCGPGTATIALAQMEFSIVALEPSLEACKIASRNSHKYSNVTVVNTTFEEWSPGICRFDAIVAPTSWHWIPPEYKYLKAASVLKDRGSLILLWNTSLKLPLEIFERLTDIFTEYIPTFAQYYKSNEREITEIRIFADEAIDSGLFSNLREESQSIEVNYSIDDYLQLLTTYSPWIALSPERRHELLEKMRAILESICDRTIPLSYQSVFHILNKKL